jgi:hypothetical protein
MFILTDRFFFWFECINLKIWYSLPWGCVSKTNCFARESLSEEKPDIGEQSRSQVSDKPSMNSNCQCTHTHEKKTGLNMWICEYVREKETSVSMWPDVVEAYVWAK